MCLRLSAGQNLLMNLRPYMFSMQLGIDKANVFEWFLCC